MYRCQRFLAAGTLLAGAMFLRQQVVAQVFRIAEMNTRQIQALNLQKTVVLIPGGILEEARLQQDTPICRRDGSC